jgi:hypothetical protein
MPLLLATCDCVVAVDDDMNFVDRTLPSDPALIMCPKPNVRGKRQEGDTACNIQKATYRHAKGCLDMHLSN